MTYDVVFCIQDLIQEKVNEEEVSRAQLAVAAANRQQRGRRREDEASGGLHGPDGAMEVEAGEEALAFAFGETFCTVETSVLKDHPIGHKNMVFQDRWSLGSP